MCPHPERNAFIMAYMATEVLGIILLHVGFHHLIFSTNEVGALSSWKDYNNSSYETGSDTFGHCVQAVDFSRLFFLLHCCFSSWVSATPKLLHPLLRSLVDLELDPESFFHYYSFLALVRALGLISNISPVAEGDVFLIHLKRMH